MDTELVVWIAVFVGGYSAVVGYLLWVALGKGKAEPEQGGGGTGSGGPDPGPRPVDPGPSRP